MTAVVDGYRLARAAQLERFEAVCQGRDASEAGSEEYRRYFGLGEFAGCEVERPLTLKDWMVWSRRTVEDEPARGPETGAAAWISAESAFWLSGAQLASLAQAGDGHAAAEIERRRVRRAAKRAQRERG